MEVIREANGKECVTGCNSDWLNCAEEVLHNNGITEQVFRQAVTNLLIKGCGKYCNIIIVGPVNCAKTFLLNPLSLIYDTF